MTERQDNLPPTLFGVAVFILSGYAGLIYEATWARYLKTVLGTEAYAQALVLGIFLGGLAVGAALAGRKIASIRYPLLGYAAIEAILAVAAIYFHDLFVVVREALEDGGTGQPVRWAAMTLMILPQSVLLGTTFPLLASSMTRSSPADSGNTVSKLYFANSFGGVIGVLAVGFVLVDFGGLPASMYAGGLASGLAALAAWGAHHRFDTPLPPPVKVPETERSKSGLLPYLIVAALGTGLASLIYEIVWIRMLALVIGSTTKAFEIMLATFIFGLAMGGLYAKRWADKPTRLRTVAWAQLLMGTFVVVTMFAYEELFYVVADIRAYLPGTEAAYGIYDVSCVLLSMALMFVPTFFAGMTLPLLTREAMETEGERSLGFIYAWNTLGSILGILLAINVLMPLLGLKHTLTVGIAIDLVLGVMLLRLWRPRMFVKGALAAATVLVVALAHAPYDPFVINSGPFRTEQLRSGANMGDLLFLEHGKTSSVAITEHETGNGQKYRSLKNNGRVDGTIVHDGTYLNFSGDALTNVTASALALLHKPDARSVGVIGIGTGLTADTLLLSDTVESVESMEIEQAVIDGMRYFNPGQNLLEDPRSKLIQTDAKTHIAAKGEGYYDIIVSVPTLVWVSGTSNLFSVQHFKAMRKALGNDGLLVQWFQLYESNPQAVASILSAVSEVFPKYMLFSVSNGAIGLVTSPNPDLLGEMAEDGFERMPRLAQRLKELDMNSVNDVRTRVIGDSELLNPYFDTFNVRSNSDYFPLLEKYASIGYFMRTTYALIPLSSRFGHLFNRDVLPSTQLREPFVPVSNSRLSRKQQEIALATAILDHSVPFKKSFENVPRHESFDLDDLESLFDGPCDFDERRGQQRALLLLELMQYAEAYLYPEEYSSLWERMAQELPCQDEIRADEYSSNVLAYLEASATGDDLGLINAASRLIGDTTILEKAIDVTVLTKVMLALMNTDRPQEAIQESLRLGERAGAHSRHAVRLIGAHIFQEDI